MPISWWLFEFEPKYSRTFWYLANELQSGILPEPSDIWQMRFNHVSLPNLLIFGKCAPIMYPLTIPVHLLLTTSLSSSHQPCVTSRGFYTTKSCKIDETTIDDKELWGPKQMKLINLNLNKWITHEDYYVLLAISLVRCWEWKDESFGWFKWVAMNERG